MATNFIYQAVKGVLIEYNMLTLRLTRNFLMTVQYNLISYATEDAVNKAKLLAEPLSLELVNILTVVIGY
jgi:hypothetical protein